MKKTFLILVMVLAIVFALAGCGEEERAAAQLAVDAYNSEINRYNEVIRQYNDAADHIEEANEQLTGVVNDAQDIINKGEEPFDPESTTALKNAIIDAQNAKVSVPDHLPALELKELSDTLKTKELKALAETTAAETEEIKGLERPDIPEVPDYSGSLSSVESALADYENSIKVLKQVTAPSDAFVMERLQLVDTITAMGAVTEDHDPNNQYMKQGGYIGAIFFRDTQVDQSKLYVSGNRNDVIDVGTQGGGCIEIFANAEDANKRNTYLGAFDGTILSGGSHYVVGTIVIRTSSELKASQQNELTEKIIEALTKID